MTDNEYLNDSGTLQNARVSGIERSNVPSFIELINAQTRLIALVQNEVETQRDTLSPRELKDLIATLGSHLSLLHRVQEAQRSIATYQLFVSVIVEWVKGLEPPLAQKLLAELRATAAQMQAPLPDGV
jgi:hypothetical protein